MQIFVDADACPVVGIIENIAKEYKVSVTLLCDTNHVLSSDCHKGDIVVSQDYGVAAMVLGKGAFAIHQSGKWYTGRSIKSCLVTSNVRTLLITMCT